jgi:pSer/pThr/pTyr-binding forkhead associated (FHA) protein
MKRPPTIVIQLIHILGPLKGEIQEFIEPAISIGRHPSCHVRFPADLAPISRKHAEIIREGNQFKLIDHSANGTFVNGKQVKEALLKDGDVLEFSRGGPKVSFLTQMKEESYVPPEPPPSKEQPITSKKEPFIAQPEAIRPEPEKRKAVKSEPELPSVEPPEEKIAIQIVKAPLTIQYGPTLRSYKQVPVTIGKNPKCDFQVETPSILDRHAQIFFSQNQYWVKDLTGQRSVQINGQPIGLQAPLRPNDELAFTPQGPFFRFLGGGRLAEVAAPSVEEPPGPPSGKEDIPQRPTTEAKTSEGLFSKVKKIFES